MKTPLLAALAVLLLAACGPPSNSSGQLTVTGDLSWGGALQGLGLKKETQATGYTCGVYLYDKLSNGSWGDERPGDTNATYVFGLSLGRASTGLSGFPTGAFVQGDASKGTSTPWPSEVAAGFDQYEGFKHGDRDVYTTGGTVSLSRFDAQSLEGTFDLTGFIQYCDNGGSCTLRAVGDFTITNVDCAP